MMSFDELVAAVEALHREDLQRWVDEAWVSSLNEGGRLHFSDMECARVQLICTLRYEYEVEEETMPLVLSLLDQLYDTRRRLNALAAAVASQDSEVREAVLRLLISTDDSGPGDVGPGVHGTDDLSPNHGGAD